MVKFINSNKKIIALLLIIVIGILLRVANISTNPPNLNQDEAMHGYEAMSYLKNGRDIEGNTILLNVDGFSKENDNRSAFYFYPLLISTKILGTNDFSIRLPSIIFGLTTIVLTYLITNNVFKSKNISLIASFFIAISPWDVYLSRIALEASAVPPMFLLSLYLWLKAADHKYLYFISTVLFSLCLYGYPINKVFIPIFFIGLLILSLRKEKINKREFAQLTLIFLTLASPVIIINLANLTINNSRFFNQIGITNLGWWWPFYFPINYLWHFSLLIFFNPNVSPSVPPIDFGKLFIFQLPLITIGAIYLKNIVKKDYKVAIFFLWLILSPIPSALTIEGVNHGLRSVTMIPILEIIAAVGLVYSYKKLVHIKYRKQLYSGFLLAAIINVLAVGIYYFNVYPVKYYSYYQKDLREAIEYINTINIKKDGIVITDQANQPFIYYLLYTKYDPLLFQRVNKNQTEQAGFTKMISFDNVRFGSLEEEYLNNPNRIFVARKDELQNIKSTKNILYPNGEIALKIIYND